MRNSVIRFKINFLHLEIQNFEQKDNHILFFWSQYLNASINNNCKNKTQPYFSFPYLWIRDKCICTIELVYSYDSISNSSIVSRYLPQYLIIARIDFLFICFYIIEQF